MDYNKTINLPKTDFPMRAGLPKREPEMLKRWQEQDVYNELLKKNADTLKMGTIATAKEAERSIVDIETLQHTNQQLISTLDEVMKIQTEGSQKRREAEARNRAYAALQNHRKRIAQLDEQMERDNARMEELLAMMADPDFYVNEDASSDAIAEHAKLKQRLAAAEEEWFTLTEELEAEMARQQERA